jgi:hypothetical protein
LISEHIVDCKQHLELYDTDMMQRLIAEFYTRIFAFLANAMDWLTKKSRHRLLDAFREDFLEHFHSDLTQITKAAKKIGDLASHSGRAEVRAVRLGIEHGIERIGTKLDQIESLARTAVQRERYVVVSVKDLLENLARASSYTHQQSHSPGQSRDIRFMAVETPAKMLAGPNLHEYLLDDIALWSAHLENYFRRDRVRLYDQEDDQGIRDPEDPSLQFRELRASQTVLRRLFEWTRIDQAAVPTENRVLWLIGPYTPGTDFENPLSLLASSFLELADQVKAAVLSYFCELRRGEELRADMPSNEYQSLIALVYGLIRQTIEQLPVAIEGVQDLSEQRFATLEGTAGSMPASVEVLGDLLPHLPNPTFCVIDSLHLLDDRTAAQDLQALFQVLLDAPNVRLLFTTTGRSACLADNISLDEQVHVDPEEGEWILQRSKSL